MDGAYAERRRWMAVLASADLRALEAALGEVSPLPGHTALRGPEIGLVIAQGRAGGGASFNLAEMTVTRCAVRNTLGAVGHAYLLGRRERQAELAAAIDAAMQDAALAEALQHRVIGPLEAARAAANAVIARRAETTRVDFATLATMRS